MEVSVLKDKLIVAENVFDDNAYRTVAQEIAKLRPKIEPTYHGTDVILYRAVLDTLFPDRKMSFILQALPEILYGAPVLAEVEKLHDLSFTLMNKHHKFTTTLTEMRGDTDYRTHTDTGDGETWTGIFMSWIWYYNPSPEKFTGGDLEVPELALTIEPRDNRLVLLPAYLKHRIGRPVFSDPAEAYYRTTINGFLTLR